MNITDALISFRTSQDKAMLGINISGINSEDLNVAVIEILAWLKLEHKRELWIAEGKKTRLKSLNLNLQFSWCNLLKRLLDSNNVFSDYFAINNLELNFKDEISEEQRLVARRSAYEQYNPEKII